MSEKKIFSVDVAMDEPMFMAVKGIAEADGVTAPELIRMLVSTMIEDRRAYYTALESIFGQGAAAGNQKRPRQTADSPALKQTAQDQ